MKYNTLAVAITNKCDLSCEMCCERGHKFSVENRANFQKNILEYIESTENEDRIRSIALTGGEVFLEKELMQEIIRTAKKCHKNTSILTNGNWCNDLETAIDEIEILKKAGLDMLGISYDRFHKQYVSDEKIINILKACKKNNIPTSIQMCLEKDTSLDEILGNIKEYLGNTTLSFVNCMPVGGGETISEQKMIRKAYDNDILCQKGSSFLISYDGKVFPCCSPMAYQLDIDLGNISEDKSVRKTLERLQNNVYLYMLRNYGFSFYLEVAKKIKLELPDKIVSPCEICAIVLSPSNRFKFLPYIFEKIDRR